MTLLLWTLIGCGPGEPAKKPVLEEDRVKPSAGASADEGDDARAGPTNRPPQITNIALRPDVPKAGEDVQCAIMGSDPEGDPVDIDVVWVVNDSSWYDQTERTLPGDNLRRGDKVKVRVTVSDGVSSVSKDSAELEVGNTPPTLLTETSAFADLNGLQVQATDVDMDELTYRLEGGPEGLTIDERTGRVAYQGTETEKGGAYKVTLIVDDGHKGTASLSFGLNVAAGAAARKVRKGSAEDPDAAPAAASGEDGAAQSSP